MSSSYPSRFIINSDYATLKNDAKGKISLTIPNLVNTTTGGDNIVYRSTLQIGASKSAGYRFYITSSKYSYAIATPAFDVLCKESGYDSSFSCHIYRQGDSFVLEAIFAASPYMSFSYTDCGQTLTLYIQSFIDPFDT